MRTRRRGSHRPKGESEAPARSPALPRAPLPAGLPIKVTSRRTIRAPVQKVFQLISRVDAQPRVTGLWLSADLLDRRPGQLTVHYRGYFAGVPLESVQRATLQPPNHVEFRQTRGGLRALAGEYSLQPIEGGETELTITLEADVGMPLIADAAAGRVLRAYVERTLDKVKLTAERDLPRVVRRARDEPSAPEVVAAASAEVDVGESAAEVAGSEVSAAARPGAEVVPEAPATAPAAPRTGRRKRRRRRRRGNQLTRQTQPTQLSQPPFRPEQGS